MTQTASVSIWVKGAEDAWDTFEKLFEGGKYHHALFFLHLSLEKIIKAVVIKHTDAHPPATHDLLRLAQAAHIELNDQMTKELSEISTFNVAARYDDEKLQFHHKATQAYASKWKTIGRSLFARFQTML